MNSAINEFRDAIQSAGMNPPDTIEPGKFHRFPGEGKRNGNTAGWCKLYHDRIGGIYGDHSTGFTADWQARREAPYTQAEREAFKCQAAEAKAQAEAERKAKQSEAASKAAGICEAAKPAPADHSYLVRKYIKPNGARLHNDALVIPMRAGGEIQSLQFIGPDGDKRFLSGGRVTGCYFSIGNPKGAAALCIAEGFATGATIHEATGLPVAVAFNAGNLGPVAKAMRERFTDLPLILCADDDVATEGNPGITKATEAARAVGGLLAIPDFGSDRPAHATDFNDLHQSHGLDAVKRAIAGASAPSAATPLPKAQTPVSGWPANLDEAAYHGLAGEIVRAIEPDTESDPAAIMLQVLVAFGGLVGKGPHFPIEGDEHHSNLFALIVGQSSKARKGTSWGRVREIFSKAIDWPPVVDGLSSGEGLKYAVRDRVTKEEPDSKGFAKQVEIDPGVTDKRLLIVESEFAQVLRQVSRAGNTLSATIRSAWDSGNLRTLTKNDPVTATRAHICIVGHITDDELRAELTATDSANGFANRFLFMGAKRSKLLHFGGKPLPHAVVSDLAGRIAKAAGAAKTLGAVKMSADARSVWAATYEELSQGHPGLFGAVTGRAEAQCLRLALIYALMDERREIELPHLLAALAIWERAAASARYIFRDSLGDPIADEILRALRSAGSEGMTRTAISKLFGKHQTAERIGAALSKLSRQGKVRSYKSKTEGAPVETWAAA